MERLLALFLLMGAGGSAASQTMIPLQVLPTTQVAPILNSDPRVASAKANMEAAFEEAGLIRRSPYEWIATATAQERRVKSGPNYNEWNVGVERTIRLPGKVNADQGISDATIEEAKASYGEARHEAAREFMTLWLDWLAAEHSLDIAQKGVSSAKQSLGAVQKRNQAGDASNLDVNLAQAELADQRRQTNEAKVLVSSTWARLSGRFPGLPRDKMALPQPIKDLGSELTWRERILAESDEIRRINATFLKSQGQSARAKADKLPDPTLGVFTTSEQGNRERLYGVSVSMPIPSGARSARYSRALAQEEAARLDAELVRRQAEANVARDYAVAVGAFDSFTMAQDGAQAMARNEAQMQRAYELGEVDLQSLLLARRQALTAATNALDAHVESLRTHLSLLIDAHWIWGLEEA